MSRKVAIVLLLLAVSALPAPADTGDKPDLATVLARHAEARGGAERWAALKSMELKGTWEAFSTPGPFTVQKARGDRWRFDFLLFGQPAAFGYDGEHAWIQGATLGVPEPARLDDAWKRNLLEDAPLLTPLLAGPGEDREIVLLGRRDADGVDAWAIRVTRKDFPEEIWYLDAESYLDVMRESMTYDVFSGGIEIPMVTYYDDFREVNGLVLPFHEERHFGTRYHVTDVETVRVDPEIDPSRLQAPPPAPEPEPEGDPSADASGNGGS